MDPAATCLERVVGKQIEGYAAATPLESHAAITPLPSVHAHYWHTAETPQEGQGSMFSPQSNHKRIVFGVAVPRWNHWCLRCGHSLADNLRGHLPSSPPWLFVHLMVTVERDKRKHMHWLLVSKFVSKGHTCIYYSVNKKIDHIFPAWVM